MDNGWLQDGEGRANLVSLLSSAREASLGMAQLHREDIIHGAISPAACFLKAARNQRGFVVKVNPLACSCLLGSLSVCSGLLQRLLLCCGRCMSV